jgi:protease PrsW
MNAIQTLVILLLIAVAPCAFWLWMIYLGDRCKPEKKSLMVKIFFFGALVGIPVAFIESALYPGSVQGNLSVSSAIYAAFVVAGLTEELAKFLVVRFGAYKSAIFSQPEDGLVYTATAALGFAALENVVYIISFGWQVILIRGIFSNLAHVLFSSLWGYPLGLYKVGAIKHRYIIYLGLVAAMLAHGFFDFLFFTSSGWTWLVLPLFLGMLVVFILMMRHSNRIATCEIK